MLVIRLALGGVRRERSGFSMLYEGCFRHRLPE